MNGIHAWLGRFTQLGGLDTFEVLIISCAHSNQSDEDIKVVALVAEGLSILSVVPLLRPLIFTCLFFLLFLCEIKSFPVQAQALYRVRNEPSQYHGAQIPT